MKWPNDIYANRLKIGVRPVILLADGLDLSCSETHPDVFDAWCVPIGGILCNSTYDMEARRYSIVCGVGLNVNNRQPTTCLAELWGGDVSRERLLAEFMNEYEDAWERCVAMANRDACPMVDDNAPVCVFLARAGSKGAALVRSWLSTRQTGCIRTKSSLSKATAAARVSQSR
jgi:hypothetical protein